MLKFIAACAQFAVPPMAVRENVWNGVNEYARISNEAR